MIRTAFKPARRGAAPPNRDLPTQHGGFIFNAAPTATVEQGLKELHRTDL
jgi:hypothetical protein